jgi:hypothetical protein
MKGHASLARANVASPMDLTISDPGSGGLRPLAIRLTTFALASRNDRKTSIRDIELVAKTFRSGRFRRMSALADCDGAED